jgi:hypothetical protein
MQLSCHSVAVVLTLVQTEQIRLNIHENNKKHSTNNTKHSTYKYTYYHNTHTLQNPHIHTPTHYKSSQNKHSTRSSTSNSHNTIKYPQYKFTLLYVHGTFIPKIHRTSTSLHFKMKSLRKNHVNSLHITSHHITSLIYTQSPLELPYL